ncbi:Appr-1-p processing [Penicillium bovifimosum]|uniref:Appr-1-p processing n=1 Tax=Penicillium bovifimosum TaxID=126998 RepID=A0A9W9L240_9EURO|nr:Appr-1-p processing [Penicillium bovifimosum]KAJ5131405.1 Appr-1-p processing [Penicillium bovifimosum]
MSGNRRGDFAITSAHGHRDSDDSIILLTSPGRSYAAFVHETPGDLFDAPNGAALIHACNCQGTWGAGLARQFRERYPAAYEIYRKHCLDHLDNRVSHKIPDLRGPFSMEVDFPLGTALVIPPQQSDFTLHRRRHWIICLFTSKDFGARVDKEEMIITSTHAALLDLREQLETLCRRYPDSGVGEQVPSGLYSSRFCTGIFNIPWEIIHGLINEIGLRINVYYPYEPSNRGRRPIRVQPPSEEHRG